MADEKISFLTIHNQPLWLAPPSERSRPGSGGPSPYRARIIGSTPSLERSGSAHGCGSYGPDAVALCERGRGSARARTGLVAKGSKQAYAIITWVDWQGALTPPWTPSFFAPLPAAGDGVLRPPNPVAGAAAGRCASWPTIRSTRSPPDPPAGNSGRYRRGRQDLPAGESLADRMAPEPRSRVEPGKPPSRRFWPFGGRLRGIRGRRIACNARTLPPEG